MERVFGTTNEEFIHNLEGNTQATKNVRQLTPAVDPKRHAIWTLGELYARIQEWAYEQYDTNEHGGIGQTPAGAFNQGIFLWGRRGGDLITFNDDFVYNTLPTTPKGTAKLDPILGVKINNIYYSAKDNIFRKNRKLHKKQIRIRYDPFDVGHAYAFVQGKWVECFSRHHTELRGRTEREIQLASEELRARNRRHGRQFNITAAKLAAFITSVEGQEALLAQRRKDLELRGVLALMGKSTLELHGLSIVSSESSSVINEEVSPATALTIDTGETSESTDDDEIYEVVIGA
jgi:putative transposase